MPKIRLLICYREGPWADLLCETYTVGTVNVVVDGGKITMQHRNSPIFAAWKDLEEGEEDGFNDYRPAG